MKLKNLFRHHRPSLLGGIGGRLLLLLFACLFSIAKVSAQQAYACYTPGNTTLTFYYDNQRSSRSGTTYDLNSDENRPGWYNDRQSITNVVFNSSFAGARPTSTYSWFDSMQNLQSITGMNYLNTSMVTNMSYMFNDTRALTSFDLSNFNTANVTNMTSMFSFCFGLTSLDLSHFNTANVTNMSSMFYYCTGLTSLDLSNFNTASVTDMGFMFSNCWNLASIYVSDRWSTESVMKSDFMFLRCNRLVGGQGTTYDANHVDAAYAHIDGGPSNPGYFTAEGALPFEPYACYTPGNTTLTFYLDNQRRSRPGLTYDLNLEDIEPGWYLDGFSSEITSVVFAESFADARPTSTYRWFSDCESLTTITGLEYLNTSEVTDMGSMFFLCLGLTSLDLSHFDTRQVGYMGGMFRGCENLVNLDLSSFTTEKVWNMQRMFEGCEQLNYLDLSSFNTAKVTNMSYMFYGCSNLSTIIVSYAWSTAAVTSSGNMFFGCTQLVGGQGTTYNANHIDAAYAHIDGGPSDPGYFTDDGAQPYACYTPGNTTLTFYYDNQRSRRTGTTYSLNSDENRPGWYNDRQSITNAVFDSSFADARPTSTYSWFYGMQNLQSITGMNYLNTSEVRNMSKMFSGCMRLTSLNLSNFNTSNVTNMSSMFSNCSGLTSLDVSGFDTQKVTDISGMFFYCSGLTSLDLSHFNTAIVTDMTSMFAHCSGLTSLDLSTFNTSKVTNMRYMFNLCSGLTSLDISSFNTEKVMNMGSMFFQCQSLTSLDLSHFNTTNVTDMEYMFGSCSGLTSLDLSHFNTANVTDMEYMFSDCNNLATIFVGDRWSTESVASSQNMFANCTKLVGGLGTVYDANHVDAAYAHVDGGPSNPGYLGFPAYAVLSENGTTLTFYCDSQRYNRPGTCYDLNQNNYEPDWFAEGHSYSISKVVFDPSFAAARPDNTYYWFGEMSELKTIEGIEYLNTSEVTSMNSMFIYCGMESVDLSTFDTSKVEDMRDMFNGCFDLWTIYVGIGWSTANVTNSSSMFQDCESLVGGMGTTYDASHVDKSYAHVDGGTSNPGYFTAGPSSYVVYDSSNTTLTFYFDNQWASHTGATETVYSLNEGENAPEWRSDGSYENITTVVFDASFALARPTSTCNWFAGMSNLSEITGIEYLNTSEVTSMRSMFFSCSSLKDLDVSHFDTQNVTSMRTMFYDCPDLMSLDLSSFNTQNVTNMHSMFQGCTSLADLDVSNFNTANVTDMSYMFNNCSSLTSLDVSNFNTAKVTSMTYMFAYCSSLTSLDLSGFDTKNVTDMSFMFYISGNIASLDVSSFNTENVTDMQRMFYKCGSLTSLDLSSFNTAKVTEMDWMFSWCSNLTTIYVSDKWSIDAVNDANNMFTNSTSLVGGMGTTFDSNHVDKAYAHIDGGTADPGYFTEKPAFLLGDVNGDGDVNVADVTALVNIVTMFKLKMDNG